MHGRVTASPVLGQHTEQGLSGWLGLSGEAGAALKADGAL
jgi:crotonobetainyl-CoA:carnitine CoA-transferase CaiB-like acyl-CoA transferase